MSASREATFLSPLAEPSKRIEQGLWAESGTRRVVDAKTRFGWLADCGRIDDPNGLDRSATRRRVTLLGIRFALR
ncbi:hypothetical protein [Haloarchaeobius sp. DFWS5]|uniref:hypothetical protein n=1 Tax=Haloarchaeobius sp. DFWS5 TaxID=3446114 RepID=UPI003EB95D1D